MNKFLERVFAKLLVNLHVEITAIALLRDIVFLSAMLLMKLQLTI